MIFSPFLLFLFSIYTCLHVFLKGLGLENWKLDLIWNQNQLENLIIFEEIFRGISGDISWAL